MTNAILRGKPHAKIPLLAMSLSLGGAFAAIPEPMLLTSLIQSNETQTAVIVYGTQGGSWNNVVATRIHAAFDGKTGTYTDLVTDEAWGGVGFTKPVRVTKVRMFGRPGGYDAKVQGAILQGANTSDFSNAVTVHVFKNETVRGEWSSESVTSATALTSAFRYYRIYTKDSLGIGRRFGDIAELEFYGYDPETVETVTPATPHVTYTCLINGRLCFKATTGADTTYIEVQQRWKGEGDDAWKEVLAITPTGTNKEKWYQSETRFRLSSDFRFRAVNAAASSDWTEVFSHEQPPYLTGTYVGSTTHYSDYTGGRSFDGIPWNVTEVTPAASSYAGLDFGVERTVTGLRYMTRSDQQASRSKNIVFEIANKADFSDAVAVYQTPSSDSAFAIGTIYPVTFDKPVTGRYGRFRSAVGQTYNLAELEFNTTDVPVAVPSKPSVFKTADGGDKTQYHTAVTWFAKGEAGPYVLTLMRAVSPYGPWVPVRDWPGTELAADVFEDVGANVMGRTYYYSVAYKYGSGETAVYGPVATSPITYMPSGWLERDPADPTKLKDGCTLICNGTPWSGKTDRVPAKVFDNNEGTYADLVSPQGCATHKIGVDFGEPVRIRNAWAAPRKDQTGRFNQLRLYATQKTAADADWMADDAAVPITESTGGAFGSFYWKELVSTNDGFFRSCYMGQVDLTTAVWMANMSELQFYGYPQNPKALAVPSELVASVFSNHVALVWKDDAYATAWTVERRQGATCLWTLLGTTGVPGFDDAAAALDGTVYQYRVTAVNATEGAASAPIEVTATPVSGEAPWTGATVFPTDGRDGAYGIRWADTGDLTHFTMTFRFVRGAGATATTFVPVARTALVGGTALKGAFADLPSEGWFRIVRIRGVVRLSVKTSANGVWTQIGESSDPAFATGSIIVGAEAVGGDDPLVGYTFSDVTLAEISPGLQIIVR